MSQSQESLIAKSEARKEKALPFVAKAKELSGDQATTAWYQAIAFLHEALELYARNHRARFLLVSCWMNLEEYNKAKTEALKLYNDLSEEQRRKMSDPILHLTLARTCQLLGEPKEAEKYAREAADLFPNYPQPYMILGEVYEQQHLYPESEQECRQCLFFNDLPESQAKMEPQDVYYTLCCLGTALTGQAKYTEAEVALSRALEINLREQLAYRCLIQVYLTQNKPHLAYSVATRCACLHPDDAYLKQTIQAIELERQLKGSQENAPGSPTPTVLSTVGPLPEREAEVYQDDQTVDLQSIASSDWWRLRSLQKPKARPKEDDTAQSVVSSVKVPSLPPDGPLFLVPESRNMNRSPSAPRYRGNASGFAIEQRAWSAGGSGGHAPSPASHKLPPPKLPKPLVKGGNPNQGGYRNDNQLRERYRDDLSQYSLGSLADTSIHNEDPWLCCMGNPTCNKSVPPRGPQE